MKLKFFLDTWKFFYLVETGFISTKFSLRCTLSLLLGISSISCWCSFDQGTDLNAFPQGGLCSNSQIALQDWINYPKIKYIHSSVLLSQTELVFTSSIKQKTGSMSLLSKYIYCDRGSTPAYYLVLWYEKPWKERSA